MCSCTYKQMFLSKTQVSRVWPPISSHFKAKPLNKLAVDVANYCYFSRSSFQMLGVFLPPVLTGFKSELLLWQLCYSFLVICEWDIIEWDVVITCDSRVLQSSVMHHQSVFKCIWAWTSSSHLLITVVHVLI